MRSNELSTNSHSQEARFQRYRLDVIAAWPENEYKRSIIAAATAVLERELAFEAAIVAGTTAA